MMDIQMIGIDHNMASVEYRELFSFTKSSQKVAMQSIKSMPGVRGCVILSTCNRMEVYVSSEPGISLDLYEFLCRFKRISADSFRQYFVTRKGEDAVRHLFVLAAGMESRIIGEDQILTQVKEALSWARECESVDKVLEVLFRMAVTAGKKVKTEISFSRGNVSAIHQALVQLQKMGCEFTGMKCMVIGNGEMGKMAAMKLKEAGADVTVTVRQYRSGVVQIPPGCHRINYADRYENMSGCSLVVSATASPNLTLTREEIEKRFIKNPVIFLDLAVPRDIDPGIRDIPGAKLYDIDDFSIDPESKELKEQLKEASDLLAAKVEEFVSWYECRDFIPKIRQISQAAAQDVSWRMGQTFQQIDVSPKEREMLEGSIETAASKVVAKLMFKLRDSVNPDQLRECLEAFGHAYPEAGYEES